MVIDSESHENDSFVDNLLDYPAYTKPRNFKGMEVPDVLLSGNHKKLKMASNRENDQNITTSS